MRNILNRLFGKKPKRRTTKTIIQDFERIQLELENLGKEISNVSWKKDLVEPKQWEAKHKEAMEQGSKFVFHYSNFITHIRCLHQWQTNTPPTLNKPKAAPTESTATLADDDQEFIDKLNEALEWKRKQK